MKFGGSMVALVTPMHNSGEIDFDSFSRLIDWHLAAGTQGLVVLGTTGESVTLTPEEHKAMIGHTLQQVAGRIPVIAGTGTNCTRTTIENTHRANALGVDACLVVTPYYNKPTQQGLFAHYEAVAKSSDKPIFLYNGPGRTGCDLLPETVARLAKLPRIIGFKEVNCPPHNRIEVLKKLVPDDFILLCGDDALNFEFLKAGARGVISVTANVVPEAMRAFCDAALREKDFERAKLIDDNLQILHRVLFLESNPIPVKWLLTQIKQIPTGIRLPLTPLAASYHDAVLKGFEQAQANKQRALPTAL
jgi:4-hydroxy-tetrahydrodipicolinate synthase